MKREFRESNLFVVVVSEKIDPLKVLLLLFSFFVCPSINLGGEFFFASFGGQERKNEFAFFSQKSVKKDREKREEQKRDKMMKRERTEEEKKSEFVRLMCVSLFSFEEECRYTTTNNK